MATVKELEKKAKALEEKVAELEKQKGKLRTGYVYARQDLKILARCLAALVTYFAEQSVVEDRNRLKEIISALRQRFL